MIRWILNNNRIRQSSQYIAAAALCVLMLCFILKLWQANLRIPFFYSGDCVFWATCIKGVIENGWYWQNPGSQEAIVTLTTAGFYTVAHEFRQGEPVRNKMFK